MPIPEYVKNIIRKNDNSINKIELHNGLLNDDIPELVDLLNSNNNISELDLYGNNIGDPSSKKLSELKYVKKLNVSFNNFSDEGIEPLVLNPNFSRLDLSSNNLSDIGAKFIEKNSKQSWINIGGNFEVSKTMFDIVNEKINKFSKKEPGLVSASTFFNQSMITEEEKIRESSPNIKPHLKLTENKR